jgi:GNAT superfamily N-acetyltransferase
MSTETPTIAPIAERAAPPATLTIPTAGGLTWRAATREDAPTWLALRNLIARADAEPYVETLEEIEEIFEGAWRDMTADSLLGFDADGALVAWAQVDSPPGDVTTVRAFCWGGVHPDRRGEGIGRELLAWGTGRARQMLAASGKDVPARIGVFVEDDAPASKHRLYERAGFGVRRYYSDLARPLTGPDAAPVPEVELTGSLRLVPWSEDLAEATRLAHNDAFRDHWGSQPQTREQWAQRAGVVVPGHRRGARRRSAARPSRYRPRHRRGAPGRRAAGGGLRARRPVHRGLRGARVLVRVHGHARRAPCLPRPQDRPRDARRGHAGVRRRGHAVRGTRRRHGQPERGPRAVREPRLRQDDGLPHVFDRALASIEL